MKKMKEKTVKDDKKKELIDTESDSLFDDSVTDSRAGPEARHKKKTKPIRSMYSESEEFGFKETETEFDSSEEGYFEDETVTSGDETDTSDVSEKPGTDEDGTSSKKKEIHKKDRTELILH